MAEQESRPDQRVGTVAVLLAAGGGTRFEGDNHKLRSVVGDRTVLQHSVDAVITAGYDMVGVVVGDDDFSDILVDDVHVIDSPNWHEGQSHSLQAAVNFARNQGADALVIGLADQPLVGTGAWTSLRSATTTPIAVATFAGVRRPPTRLAKSVWDDLPTEGDAGARELVKESPDLVTEVPCAGDPTDVDTTEALENVRQRHRDRIAVRELLGREPMGAFEVVVRNEAGEPVVLKNHPVLANGRPMPTLYWLCGSRESLLIGRLESAQGVRRAEAELGLDVINASHDRYCAERDAILAESGVEPKHRPTGGVGGTRNGVKCLHAHYGYWLAGGDDPVGQWVHDHLHEVG